MARVPEGNVEEKFLEFMKAHGVEPVKHKIIADGKLHRFEVEGHTKGTQNGAYILHADGWPNGWFENLKTSERHKWIAAAETDKAKQVQYSANTPSKEEIEAKLKARELEKQNERDTAARKASYLYRKAEHKTDHPYMEKKGLEDVKVKVLRGSIIIPFQNSAGKITTVQFIDADGNKRFLSGGEKKGSYHQIGAISDKTIIAEGFATGMSIHKATGKTVLVSGDAGNLKAVAEAIKAKHPKTEIVIAADNDQVGLQKAHEAAKAVGGSIRTPPRGNDFNDYFAAKKKAVELSR